MRSTNICYKVFNILSYISKPKPLSRGEVYFEIQNYPNFNFPLFLLSNFSSKLILNNLCVIFYLQSYYNLLLKSPISLLNLNTAELVPAELLLHTLSALKTIKWSANSIRSSFDFVEMLFIAMSTKNINDLMGWIRSYFEKTNLKKHKKLFLFLKLIFSTLIWNYNTYFLVKGVHLSLKGKFAKSGSVRKSRRYILKGQVSRVNKGLGMLSKKFTIRTLTGVLGLKFCIFF